MLTSHAGREMTRQISLEATEWVTRLRARDPAEGPEDGLDIRGALLSWLQRSPQHVREFMVAGMLDEELHGVTAKRVVDLERLLLDAEPEPLEAPSMSAVAHLPKWYSCLGLTSTLALVAILLGLMMVAWSPKVLPNGEIQSATPRVIHLADGTAITLAAHSRVNVMFDDKRRFVVLNAGEATFAVADDPRPFQVLAGHSILETAAGNFDVHRWDDRTKVVINAGVVALDPGPPMLGPGAVMNILDPPPPTAVTFVNLRR